MPAIVNVHGFSSHSIFFDTLHVMFRGVGPDYVASTLIVVFGHQQLSEAHTLAHSWCRAHGLELSVDEFTFSFEGKFPNLNAKGWDVRCLILWLVTWLEQILRQKSFVCTSCDFHIRSYSFCEAEVVPVRSRSWQDREYAKVMNMSLCKQAAAILGFMIP